MVDGRNHLKPTLTLPVSGENGDPQIGDPGSPISEEIGDPGPQFNIILGTPGSPFSHENGDPCVKMGTLHAKIPLLHVSEVKMSVALVYTHLLAILPC